MLARVMRGLGSLRFYLLQLVLTLAVLLLALEAWSRLFEPADKIVWPLIQVPAVGTTFQPDSRVVFTNGLDFRVEERTNEAGFLDRPLPPVPRSPGTCRIALVGDSFIEAAQVPIRQKVQVRLEEMAQARWPGRRFETMAVGFSGTGQINQLGYYETFVRPRRPDIVVLVFVNNDFANNSSLLEAIRVGWHPQHTPRVFARENAEGRIELQPPDPDWSSYRLPVPADTQPWLHAKLHRASRLYRWVYAKLTLLYPGLAARMGAPISNADQAATRLQALVADPGFARLLAGWDPATNGDIDTMFGNEGPLPLAFEQALRFTRFAFDTYNRETAEDGSHLVVLAGEEVGGRIEARLKTMLAERSIPFLSLKDFIRAKGGALEAAHWRHDAHWSPQGHAWAAELLADHIAAGHFCPGT